LYRFLAIAVLLDVKDIPQVGPLQWGRIDLSDRGPAKHLLRVIRRIVNYVLAALDAEFRQDYVDSGRQYSLCYASETRIVWLVSPGEEENHKASLRV
jgi:hypothetical protein